MKRFLSIIVALMMLVSIIPSAVALSDETPSFVVVGASGSVGDTVDVKINIENNPGITALQLMIKYSGEDLQLLSIKDNSLFPDAISNGPLTNHPFKISWFSSSSSDETISGTLATLSFKILREFETSAIEIDYDEDNVFNVNLDNQYFEKVSGAISVIQSSTEPVSTEPESTVPVTTEPPTTKPTEAPTTEPTEAPTTKPTEAPTTEPTEAPTTKPTEAPTTKPTEDPTTKPTEAPTTEPTKPVVTEPTEAPTAEPTKPVVTEPTEAPSIVPTEVPATNPTVAPSTKPSEAPTTEPTEPTTQAPTTEPTTEPVKVLLGDVNGDGKVNVKDATMIQKSAASLVTLSSWQVKAADVNADGKVNVKDATEIQRHTAGIDTGFNIGKQ